jgi:hypothetical protein
MLAMIISDVRVPVALAVGIGLGIYFFFKGFLVYREFRVVEDTPEVPIRSMAMGLVHIYGAARPGSLGQVPSPVSHTPCLFYKVDIDRWESDGQGGSWTHWKTDWGGTRFLLSDATGRVTVDAHGCDFLVERNMQAETSAGASYASVNEWSDSSGKSALPTNMDLVIYAESVTGSVWSRGTGRYRLTEYILMAGWSYDVVGTYGDDPDPVGGQAEKLIHKGTNERTFVISSQNQKTTQAELRHRALVRIFGGAALAIVCLVVLLQQLGMI